jgi:DNA-binding MarR family transcriptional regulator
MKTRPAEDPRTGAVTALALSIFRAHGALLARGDALVEPFGLTSARWQVLGAVALSGGQVTVPQVARTMGLTRQAIQKQVDLLKKEGLMHTVTNPDHERSQLLQLTASGQRAYARADARWRLEAARLAQQPSLQELRRATDLLNRLTDLLSAEAPARGVSEK